MAANCVTLTEAIARGTASAGEDAWRQFCRAVQTGKIVVHCTAAGVPEVLFDRAWIPFLAEFGCIDAPTDNRHLQHIDASPPCVTGSLISTVEPDEAPSAEERAARAIDRTVRRHLTTSAPRTSEAGEWDLVLQRIPGGGAPSYDMLWFDREAAWRAGISVPVRATEITVEVAGLAALWPRRQAKPGRPKKVSASKMEAAFDLLAERTGTLTQRDAAVLARKLGCNREDARALKNARFPRGPGRPVNVPK